jgi:GNAT superfamily N-acetyltransferase
MLDASPAHVSATWVRDLERAGVDGFTVTTNIDLGRGVRSPVARRSCSSEPERSHMHIAPLTQDLISDVYDLMALGEPYVRVRTHSDYWLYAHLFSSTCPVATIDGRLAGAVIAFHSQDDPDDVYVQDVMTHPEQRRRGVTRALLGAVIEPAEQWGCRRLYLTSEPENSAAHATWLALGFSNLPGDVTVNGVTVVMNYKGPGKDRAVYQLELPRRSLR